MRVHQHGRNCLGQDCSDSAGRIAQTASLQEIQNRKKKLSISGKWKRKVKKKIGVERF
jgi:hypothetical protein